jgi:hypothetical protein
MGCLGLLCAAACSGNTSSENDGGAGKPAASAAGDGSGEMAVNSTGGGETPLASAGSAGMGGGPGAADGIHTAGTAGAGGRRPNAPTDATKVEECRYNGGGGANGYSCDVVSVAFSQPLPTEGLTIEVTSSSGDVLGTTTEAPSDYYDPSLVEQASDDGAQALGFKLTAPGGTSFSAEWIDVVVKSGDATAADSRLPLIFSCVAFTVDDWCWMSKPVSLQVKP